MKKSIVKALSVLLIFASVFAVMLTGCGSGEEQEDESTIEKMSKAEAEEFFFKAYEDTVNANYLVVDVIVKASQEMEYEGEKQSVNEDSDVKVIAGKDANGVLSVSVINAEGSEDYDEFYRGNTKYIYYINDYDPNGGSVSSYDSDSPYTVASVLDKYIFYAYDMKKTVEGLFAMGAKLSYKENTVTAKVKSDDFEEFAINILGVGEDSSEIEDSKEMLKEFSFAIEITVDDKGFIKEYSFTLNMSVANNGQNAVADIKIDMEFNDINADSSVEEPVWLTEYLSDPINFADRYETDWNGDLVWYEVDTRENGFVVKTVVYNADGSVQSTVDYERNENGNVLSRIVRSSDGKVTQKEINEYNGEGDMVKHTLYEGDLLSLVKTWNYDTGIVVTTEYENGVIICVREVSDYEYYEKITFYENGKPIQSDTRTEDGDFTTNYYYKLSGELFCYSVTDDSSWETVFYDAEGNMIDTSETPIDNYTYIHTEKDASGKILFEAEYNYYMLVTTVYYEYDDAGELAGRRKVTVDGTMLWREVYTDGVCVLKEVYTYSLLTDIYEYNEKGVCIRHTLNAIDGRKYVKEYNSETGKLEKEYSYYVSGDYYLAFYDENELKVKEAFVNADGTTPSYTLFEYNEDKKISRQEKYNADGELYQYAVYEHFGEDGWNSIIYAADGSVIGTDSSDNYGSGG